MGESNRPVQQIFFAVYEVKSKTLHECTKETISRISFTGFNVSLILRRCQLRINRVHSSPADLWTNTWAHAPATLNSLLPTSFDQRKPISLSVLVCHCIFLVASTFFPQSLFLYNSLDFYSHTCTSQVHSTEARFQKLSFFQLTSKKNKIKKSTYKIIFECLIKALNNLAPTVPLNTIRSPLQIHHSKTRSKEKQTNM